MNRYFVFSRRHLSESVIDFISYEYTSLQLIIDEPDVDVFGDYSILESDYTIFPIASWGFDISSFYEFIIAVAEKWMFKKNNVFFDLSDSESISAAIELHTVFKVSASKDNGARGMFYPIKPWGDVPSIENSSYDVSFQGTLNTHLIRQNIPSAIENCKKIGLSTYYKDTLDYFYNFAITERIQYSSEFSESILNSKFVLCPRGGGLSSHRLYEVLAAGRIPIIYSDRLVLPLEDSISWDSFSIRVPECDILDTHKYIDEFLAKNDIIQASKLAIWTWKKYFSGGKSLKHFLDKSFLVSFLN